MTELGAQHLIYKEWAGFVTQKTPHPPVTYLWHKSKLFCSFSKWMTQIAIPQIAIWPPCHPKSSVLGRDLMWKSSFQSIHSRKKSLIGSIGIKRPLFKVHLQRAFTAARNRRNWLEMQTHKGEFDLWEAEPVARRWLPSCSQGTNSILQTRCGDNDVTPLLMVKVQKAISKSRLDEVD